MTVKLHAFSDNFDLLNPSITKTPSRWMRCGAHGAKSTQRRRLAVNGLSQSRVAQNLHCPFSLRAG
jgi:hypothetical protein